VKNGRRINIFGVGHNHIRWCSCMFLHQMGSCMIFRTVAWIVWNWPCSVVSKIMFWL